MRWQTDPFARGPITGSFITKVGDHTVCQRPKFRGALNLEDIQPGLKVVVHSLPHDIVSGQKERLVILSRPYKWQGGLWVKVLWPYTTHIYSDADFERSRVRKGDMMSKSLADMGVVAYEDGHWYRWSYTTRARSPSRGRRVR